MCKPDSTPRGVGPLPRSASASYWKRWALLARNGTLPPGAVERLGGRAHLDVTQRDKFPENGGSASRPAKAERRPLPHAGAPPLTRRCKRLRRSRPVAQRLRRPLGQSPVWYVSCGAGGGSRTHTPLRTRDFESRASAIPPLRHAAATNGPRSVAKAPFEDYGSPLRPARGRGVSPDVGVLSRASAIPQLRHAPATNGPRSVAKHGLRAPGSGHRNGVAGGRLAEKDRNPSARGSSLSARCGAGAGASRQMPGF